MKRTINIFYLIFIIYNFDKIAKLANIIPNNLKENINDLLVSGEKSGFTNEMIGYCINLSQSYLWLKVSPLNRDKIMNDEGFNNIKDFAYDCIAEAFEVREGYFYQFNDYFKNLKDLSEEEAFSKLRSFMWCATDQRIYELNNKHYGLIRKAVRSCVDRNHLYQFINNKNKTFVFKGNINEIKFDLPQYTMDEIVEILIDLQLNAPPTTFIMQEFFNTINKLNEKCKAVDLNILVQAIVEYDNRRQEDYFLNVSNIEFLRDKIYFYEEFNENLKKSLENEKNKIKKLIYNNINHYFTCKKSDVIYEDPQYPSYNLYKKLIENKINSLEILKILFIVFGLLKIQSEYCKALQYKILLATLIKYYLIFL